MKITPASGHILLKRAEVKTESVLGVPISFWEVVDGGSSDYEKGTKVITTDSPIEVNLGADKAYLIEPDKIGGTVDV